MEKNNFSNLKPSNEEILKSIKNKKITSAREIMKNLDKKITLPGLMKRLNILLKNNEICKINISKSFWKPRGITKKQAIKGFNYLNLKEDGRISKYYIYLPITSNLSEKLNKTIQNLEKKEDYKKIIKKIAKEHTKLEMYCKYVDNFASNPKLIRKNIRKEYLERSSKEKIKGWRISDYDVETISGAIKLFCEGGKEADSKVDIVNIKFIKIKDKEYFFVKDELIPKEKLIRFLSIIEFPPFIRFLLSDVVKSSIIPPEIINLVNKIVEMTQDLFIKIVNDSQIKI